MVKFSFKINVELTTGWASGSHNGNATIFSTLSGNLFFDITQRLSDRDTPTSRFYPNVTDHILAVSASEGWEQDVAFFRLAYNDTYRIR